MNFKNLSFALLVVASSLMMSCGAGETADTDIATIKGAIMNADGRQIFLEDVNGNSAFAVDTAVVNNNKVVLSADVSAGMYRLRFPELRNVQAPLIYLDNDSRLEIDLDVQDPGAYTVIGDEENTLLRKTLKRQDELAKQSVELKTEIRSNTDPVARQEANKKLVEVVKLSEAEVKQTIEDSKPLNPNLTAFLLNLLDPNTNRAMISAELKKLQQADPDSKLITQMNNRFKVAEKPKSAGISIGAIAPDIVQSMPDGKSLALSSLRGKYVLIDFWASWCRPCRFENPNVVRTYHEYKDKGFDVFSVSLDKNKDRWVKAIKDDNLVWPNHVSDLKAWSNAAARKYGVGSIPATFLIDPEGKVIARNLRGPALENKLKEVMGDR